MDKFERFLRNLKNGEGKSSRARRRLMDRELKKLGKSNDGTTGDRLDVRESE